jgi:hypothetical protein
MVVALESEPGVVMVTAGAAQTEPSRRCTDSSVWPWRSSSSRVGSPRLPVQAEGGTATAFAAPGL